VPVKLLSLGCGERVIARQHPAHQLNLGHSARGRGAKDSRILASNTGPLESSTPGILSNGAIAACLT
jgi:hypothetical protein